MKLKYWNVKKKKKSARKFFTTDCGIRPGSS